MQVILILYSSKITKDISTIESNSRQEIGEVGEKQGCAKLGVETRRKRGIMST